MPQYKATIELDGFSLEVVGASPHELVAGLTEVRNSEAAALVGNIRQTAPGQQALGQLGARLIEETPHEQPSPPQPQPQQAPAPQQQGDQLPPGARIMPGAPTINGQPAWLVPARRPDGRDAQAFVHPRVPDEEFNQLERTDNPMDPRLAAGTARFFKFVN